MSSTTTIKICRTVAKALYKHVIAHFGTPDVFKGTRVVMQTKRMFGFARSEPVAVGSAAQLALEMRADALTTVDENGARLVRPGRYEIAIEGLRTAVVLTGAEVEVEPSPFDDHE